jgi:uncharacterized membrane protein
MDLILATIYMIGGAICHQRPDRSLFWDGHQLPVCARCTGLYVSGAVGLMAWAGLKAARAWRPITINPRLALRAIVIAAVPTAVSVASGAAGVWDGANITRALFAVPLGACAGAIVAAVFTKDLR